MPEIVLASPIRSTAIIEFTAALKPIVPMGQPQKRSHSEQIQVV